MTAVDSTVMDTMAAAAMDTMVVAVDSRGMAVTTTTWRRCRPPKTQPAVRGTGAQSATVTGGMRADARQARWADIALAGGEGAGFTCRFPRSGRVDDALHSARPSLWRSSLMLKMKSTSPCL